MTIGDAIGGEPACWDCEILRGERDTLAEQRDLLRSALLAAKRLLDAEKGMTISYIYDASEPPDYGCIEEAREALRLRLKECGICSGG